jgi:hypothetical protein
VIKIGVRASGVERGAGPGVRGNLVHGRPSTRRSAAGGVTASLDRDGEVQRTGGRRGSIKIISAPTLGHGSGATRINCHQRSSQPAWESGPAWRRAQDPRVTERWARWFKSPLGHKFNAVLIFGKTGLSGNGHSALLDELPDGICPPLLVVLRRATRASQCLFNSAALRRRNGGQRRCATRSDTSHRAKRSASSRDPTE